MYVYIYGGNMIYVMREIERESLRNRIFFNRILFMIPILAWMMDLMTHTYSHTLLCLLPLDTTLWSNIYMYTRFVNMYVCIYIWLGYYDICDERNGEREPQKPNFFFNRILFMIRFEWWDLMTQYCVFFFWYIYIPFEVIYVCILDL